MNNKILNYMMENWGCDEIDADAVKEYINKECSADDAVEYANILVYINEVQKEINEYIFSKM